MYQNNLSLPHLVYVKDFVEICDFYVVTHPTGYLHDNGIDVRGPEGGEYVRGKDLLALCEPDCNRESGLGLVLEHFLIRR